MDLLADVGRVAGFTFAAGLNLYATVALIGLAVRFGWVALPPTYQVFDNDLIIYAALVLYAIEFVADKIPWVDSVWDAIHTLIRPVGGAAIAVMALAPETAGSAAFSVLLGGLVSGGSHITKAGTRVIANTSPEPFSNWALSLGEDALVLGLGFVALKYPVAALAVTLGFVALFVVFAAVLLKAFRRLFVRASGAGRPRASTSLAAGALAALLMAGTAAAVGPEAGTQTPPGPPAGGQPSAAGQRPRDDDQQPRPVFRGGANFVRVDVLASRDGEAVRDLKLEDFEVYEDGVLQKVETFEHVQIQTGGSPAARVEPRSVRESREMAADPRARVFVIYLDTWHMRQGSGFNVRRPLLNLLQRVIGDEDLVAIMLPQMSAADITFTRRTDHLAALLQSVMPLDIGKRDQRILDDPVEQNYTYCYPPALGEGPVSAIAREMINRRRERQSIDALSDLVNHLGGVREERKAILFVSEGWLLYRENRALAEISQPRVPVIGVGPTGRLETSDRNNPYGSGMSDCDRDRMNLANLDNWMRFREVLDEANSANATLYPVDPRGLAVFDTDIGPEPPPTLEQDLSMLRGRLDTLRMAAENTDGIAVINSNDIDGGLRRVVADLTSYYLLGYSSTNSRFDGRFRSIRVRVKRPGVEIRARRGYRAPTEAEVSARAAAPTPPVVDAAAAAVTRAVATVDATRDNLPFRLLVSPGWWTPPGPAVAGKPAGAEAALWIYGEIAARGTAGEDWRRGGEAEVAILSAKGETVVSYTVPLEAGSRSFASRFPRSDEDVWLDPGTYAVRVRVTPAAGGLPTTDTTRFELPVSPKSGELALGQPVYARKGQTGGGDGEPTADLRFRRTERIVAAVSSALKPAEVGAELLDRMGQALAVPATAVLQERDGAFWVRAEAALASLAPGSYVLRITAAHQAERRQVLAPFRIIP